MNFVKNKNFLLFRIDFVKIILRECLKKLILCILAPIEAISFCFCCLRLSKAIKMKDLAESGTIVEKYEISFAPKKENRFALFKFLAIFTK